MKARGLVVWTVLALGLAAFIFFERDVPSTDERRELAMRVVPVEADEVVALELTWPVDEESAEEGPLETHRVRLERTSPTTDSGETPRWNLAEPNAVRADDRAVMALLDQITRLEKERDITGFEPDRLGLDRPRVVAELETATDRFRLEVGSKLPLSSRWAMRGNDPDLAFEVPGTPNLLDDLRRSAADWRDKRLFPAARSEVRAIELQPEGSEEPIRLGKRGDREILWLEGTLEDRTDAEAASGLLATLTSLEAREILDPGEASRSSAPSSADAAPDHAADGRLASESTVRAIGGIRGTVRVEIDGREKPWEIRILGRDLAEVDGQQVRFDTSPLEAALQRSASSWRSRAWTHLQVFALEWARFETGDDQFEVVRDQGHWRRGEDRMDYSAVTDALYPMTEMRAVELLDRAAASMRGFDLEREQTTVVLGTTTDQETLRLHDIRDGLAAVSVAGRDGILLLPEPEVRSWLDAIAGVASASPEPTTGPDP